MVRRGMDRPQLGDWLLLAGGVLFSLLLLSAGEGLQRDFARFLGHSLFLPLQPVIGFGQGVTDAHAELRYLRRRLVEEEIDRVQLSDLRGQNRRLRRLLGFASRDSRELLPAQVVGRSADRFGEILVLAVPQTEELRAGETVIGVGGLVGCVEAPGWGQGRVRTIRHGGLPVSATLLRSRDVGLVRWDPWRRRLRLDGIPLQGETVPGDSVVTSGHGGIFPPGVPIGWVDGVSDDSTGLVKDVTVHPFVNFDRIEEAFLLRE